MRTEVVKASKMQEKVFDRLYGIRFKSREDQYEKDLKAYLRAKGKREEVRLSSAIYSMDGKVGYYTLPKGASEPVFHPRPTEPHKPPVWSYTKRQTVGNRVWASRQYGLLGDSLYNRTIRPERVMDYSLEMENGKWADLLSDPIAITVDGQVVNGQHRLAAIEAADGFGNTDPAFLVIWDVDPHEALYADGSHRTAVDEKTIAVKLVKGGRAA